MIKKIVPICLAILALATTSCSTVVNDYKRDETFKNTSLMVNLAKGQMQTSAGVITNFNPVNFTIANDQCKQIVLTQYNNAANQTPLKACFFGNKLFLDPRDMTNDNLKGAIHFDYNPLWQQGFTYHGVTSKGYTHLIGTDVTIKIVNFAK